MKSSDKEEMEKEMLKEAGGWASVAPWLWRILGHGAAGAGYATVLDYTAHGDDPESKWTAERKGQWLVSALLGSAGTGMGHLAVNLGKGVKGISKAEAALKGIQPVRARAGNVGAAAAAAGVGTGLLAAAPGKNMAEAIAGNTRRATDALEALSKEKGGGAMPWVIGGLGAAGLGLGGYGLYKWLQGRDKAVQVQSKMRIKLPGVQGDPNSGAEVEVPINPAKISPGLMSRINSTVLRRTRSNVRYAANKIDPQTGKKIPYEEWVMKYGDQDDREALRQELSESGDQQGNIDNMSQELSQPLPPGDPRLKTAGYIPPAFAAALTKAAADINDDTRLKHESYGAMGAGNLLSGAALAALGSWVGNKVGDTTGSLVGMGLGTLAGLLAPTAIGLNLGASAKPLSEAEQKSHDQELPIGEYLIPGYGAYQLARRAQGNIKAYRGEEKSASALEKIAAGRMFEKKGSREGHEVFGSTLSTFPTALAAGLTGSLLAEKHGWSPTVGRVVGGMLGAFIPGLVGGTIAHMGKPRTVEEQLEHDKGDAWMEYVIPGYAAYQLNRRKQAEEDEKNRWRKKMKKAVDELNEAKERLTLPGVEIPLTFPIGDMAAIQKGAGMTPPPQPPPAPAGSSVPGPAPAPAPAPAPPPTGTQQTRQVDPNQNQPSQGIKRPAKMDGVRSMAQRAGQQVQLAAEKGMFQALPSQRGGGAGAVHGIVGGIMDRIQNIRASRYAR